MCSTTQYLLDIACNSYAVLLSLPIISLEHKSIAEMINRQGVSNIFKLLINHAGDRECSEDELNEIKDLIFKNGIRNFVSN